MKHQKVVININISLNKYTKIYKQNGFLQNYIKDTCIMRLYISCFYNIVGKHMNTVVVVLWFNDLFGTCEPTCQYSQTCIEDFLYIKTNLYIKADLCINVNLYMNANLFHMCVHCPAVLS